MAYGYMRPEPIEVFRNWVKFQTKLIEVALEEGYTREEAIELLKVHHLDSISDNTGLIGGNY